MSTQGLAEFRDRYEALIVAACEWRAMHVDPEDLAGRVFAVLHDQPGVPDLRSAYRVVDKVVLEAYVQSSNSRSILDRLRGERSPLPNAPRDTKEEAKLRDAVSRLRRRDRDLLQLAYWDELAESELAEVLETDTQEVAVRREKALTNYQALVRRLSASTDVGEPSRVFRSIKPGVRTRWQ